MKSLCSPEGSTKKVDRSAASSGTKISTTNAQSDPKSSECDEKKENIGSSSTTARGNMENVQVKTQQTSTTMENKSSTENSSHVFVERHPGEMDSIKQVTAKKLLDTGVGAVCFLDESGGICMSLSDAMFHVFQSLVCGIKWRQNASHLNDVKGEILKLMMGLENENKHEAIPRVSKTWVEEKIGKFLRWKKYTKLSKMSIDLCFFSHLEGEFFMQYEDYKKMCEVFEFPDFCKGENSNQTCVQPARIFLMSGWIADFFGGRPDCKELQRLLINGSLMMLPEENRLDFYVLMCSIFFRENDVAAINALAVPKLEEDDRHGHENAPSKSEIDPVNLPASSISAKTNPEEDVAAINALAVPKLEEDDRHGHENVPSTSEINPVNLPASSNSANTNPENVAKTAKNNTENEGSQNGQLKEETESANCENCSNTSERCTEAMKKATEYEAQLKETKTVLKELNIQIAKHVSREEENKKLKAQLQKIEKENKNLMRQALQHVSRKEENKKLKAQLLKIEKENKNLMRQALQHVSRKEENKKLKAQLLKIEKENEKLKRQALQHVSREEENKKLKAHILEIEKENENLKRQASQDKKEDENLRKSKAELLAKYEVMEQLTEKLTEQKSDAEKAQKMKLAQAKAELENVITRLMATDEPDLPTSKAMITTKNDSHLVIFLFKIREPAVLDLKNYAGGSIPGMNEEFYCQYKEIDGTMGLKFEVVKVTSYAAEPSLHFKTVEMENHLLLPIDLFSQEDRFQRFNENFNVINSDGISDYVVIGEQVRDQNTELMLTSELLREYNGFESAWKMIGACSLERMEVPKMVIDPRCRDGEAFITAWVWKLERVVCYLEEFPSYEIPSDN